MTQNAYNDHAGCCIPGTVLEIRLIRTYHFLDQVDQVFLLITFLYPRGQFCRLSVFAGNLNPGAVLIVKFCGTKISANVTDFVLNHKKDHITYFL